MRAFIVLGLIIFILVAQDIVTEIKEDEKFSHKTEAEIKAEFDREDDDK